MSDRREIVVGSAADGSSVDLPVVQLLTGRGFITGKSGSGKSNTASVVAEELLEAGFPLLVVDTDGEYYGLKEEYEMLHAGADEECDVQIGPEHAEQMATLALVENVPIILDVSGYLDEDEADDLLRETARQLFVREKKLKKPFLLIVEEVHEYIPEGGGVGETGNLLIKIGKRGRKHGLGILGISQRPADVKKDFITQANWLVWHRLTWDNDTNVVGRIMDSAYADYISELADGQAFLQTDWTDDGVRKVQFRRKRTFDAGATPGLDDFERPELKSVSDALVGDLQEISERSRREEDRIAELERQLANRDDRIEELEDELARARDVSGAAQQMANALRSGTGEPSPSVTTDEIRRLHEEIVDLERQRTDLERDLESRTAELRERESEIERLEAENERLREDRDGLKRLVDDPGNTSSADPTESGTSSADSDGAEPSSIIEGEDELEFGYTEAPAKGPNRGDILVPSGPYDVTEALDTVGVRDRFERACGNSRCSEETARRVVDVLLHEGAMDVETVAARVERSTVAVQSLLSELATCDLLTRVEGRTYGPSDRLATLVTSERIE